MSYTGQNVIDYAALMLGDPRKERVKPSELLVFLNAAARTMCLEMHLIVRRATFTLVKDFEVYSYPEDMVQLQRFEATDNPSDTSTYRTVREMGRDQWSESTNGLYPSGNVPARYFADTSTFFLDCRPTVTVPAGGRVTYWAVPDTISSPSTQDIEFPLMLRERLGLEVANLACVKDELADRRPLIRDELDRLMDLSRKKMEDRADDRRSGLRLSRAATGFGGQT